jgi:hypothetical protein
MPIRKLNLIDPRHPDHPCHDDEWLRKLNPIDPRNIGHPLHDEKWLELARVLGRMDAREQFDRLHHKGKPDGNPEA